ncbi:NAD(P)/FAD-dependent oxidoreductase [Nocardioides humi]|uniref:FAD-dependent oxidoreductase n=1 Tax=Nocardioides humi TaxID=449461 RepID=A0ABN2AF42_9ACTN|nr:FAD-dependent oxidoreductase [Nocardioides humi]
MHRGVLIVGASLAAVNAAESLRQEGYAGPITMIGDESALPYSRPPLSKEGLLGAPLTGTVLRTAEWYGVQGIDLRLGTRAVELDARRQLVRTADGSEAAYGRLIVTTGSSAKAAPGRANPHVLRLRTQEDCVQLRQALLSARTLVIIGGGFLGLEIASIAVQVGIRCVLIEALPHLLSVPFGDEMGDWFGEVHRSQGVAVRCGVPVVDVAGVPGRFAVHLADGEVVEADLVVAAVGTSPSVEWLRTSGLAIGDGVICDTFGQASVPGVYAAGDVGRSYNDLYDQHLRIEHWTNAVERGRAVALAALGTEPTPYRAVPYFWSQQYTHMIHFVGHAFAATATRLRRIDDRSRVGIYGRGARLSAALCINAPHVAARLRAHIAQGLGWAAAVEELDSLAMHDMGSAVQDPSIG